MLENAAERVRVLQGRGVIIPAPQMVWIAPEVPLEAIAAGACLHPFSRISGAETRIDAQAQIGPGGAAVVEDSWVGRGAQIGTLGPFHLLRCSVGPYARLGSGSAAGSILLGAARADAAGETLGLGCRLRSHCLLEEGARMAQHGDMKMSILLAEVTVGSHTNWCDLLVAGGAGRWAGDFTEIGSGAIHFNFTPYGDKATASRLGDVPGGVFLRQPRIFVGGHASLIGPVEVPFGALLPAGRRYRGALTIGTATEPNDGARTVPVMRTDGWTVGHPWRILDTQMRYLGELAALQAWYRQIRPLLAPGSDGEASDRRMLYRQAATLIDAQLQERWQQLRKFVLRLMRASTAGEKLPVREEQKANHRRTLAAWEAIEGHMALGHARWQSAAPRELLAGLARLQDAFGDRPYVERMRALEEDPRRAGEAWLRQIVAAAWPSSLADGAAWTHCRRDGDQ